MPRQISEVKKEMDGKFKEITSIEKKIEAATVKLEKDINGMTHFGILQEESKILAMRRQLKVLRAEMDKIELEAYGTWIPRIRQIKAESDARDAEREEREEARRVAKNSRVREKRLAE